MGRNVVTNLCANVAERLAGQRGIALPEGKDRFGLKAVDERWMTSNGHRWPFPGGTTSANANLTAHGSSEPCPSGVGDGLTVAIRPGAMSSSGMPIRLVLLVAFSSEDVEGEADGKVRVIGDVLVVEDFFVREVDWSSADLRSAHLQYANLESAHLEYADLQYAKLRYANLESANLRVADLRFADLRGCIHSAGTVWPDGFDVDRLKF